MQFSIAHRFQKLIGYLGQRHVICMQAIFFAPTHCAHPFAYLSGRMPNIDIGPVAVKLIEL